MFRIIVIALLFSSFTVYADTPVSVAEAKRVQAEIQYAGYECEQVDSIETRWFFGTTANVICDRIFRFVLEYGRGGVSVRVVSL